MTRLVMAWLVVLAALLVGAVPSTKNGRRPARGPAATTTRAGVTVADRVRGRQGVNKPKAKTPKERSLAYLEDWQPGGPHADRGRLAQLRTKVERGEPVSLSLEDVVALGWDKGPPPTAPRTSAKERAAAASLQASWRAERRERQLAPFVPTGAPGTAAGDEYLLRAATHIRSLVYMARRSGGSGAPWARRVAFERVLKAVLVALDDDDEAALTEMGSAAAGYLKKKATYRGNHQGFVVAGGDVVRTLREEALFLRSVVAQCLERGDGAAHIGGWLAMARQWETVAACLPSKNAVDSSLELARVVAAVDAAIMARKTRETHQAIAEKVVRRSLVALGFDAKKAEELFRER